MDVMGAVLSATLVTVVIVLSILFYGLMLSVIKNVIIWILARLLGTKIATLIVNVGTFVGVIHHEFSHALMAVLTGAKVKKITWFTLFGNGNLGSVVFCTRGNILLQNLQITASSLAPLYCGTITLFILYKYYMANAVSLQGWNGLLLAYVAFSLLLHCDLSKQDIEVANKGLKVFALMVFVVALVVKLLI